MLGDGYKVALSRFPTGVCLLVINTATEDVGVTISSFVPISLDPPIVQVSLKNGSRFLSAIEHVDRFSLYVLSEAQAAVASHFARFPASVVDSQRLGGAVAVLRCSMDSLYVKGDHTLVFGLVGEFQDREGASLMYYKSRFLVAS